MRRQPKLGAGWTVVPALVAVLTSLVLLASCSKKMSTEDGRQFMVKPPAPTTAAGPTLQAAYRGQVAAQAAAETARKLVRTVNLDLEVKATDAAAEELRQLAVRLGGYVAGVNATRANDLLHYSLTLRVPAARLDDALAAA